MKTGKLALREEFGWIRRIQFWWTYHSRHYRTQKVSLHYFIHTHPALQLKNKMRWR